MVDRTTWVDPSAVRRPSRPSRSAAPPTDDRGGDAGAQRRQQIVAAAVRTIEELGPQVGTAQIAERAGVPRPHVYRHFTSKEDLEEEVTRAAAADLVERVRPTMTRAGTLAEIVRGSVEAAVGWAAEHPHLYRFMAARHQTRALHGTRMGRGRFLTLFVDAMADYLRTDDEAPPELPDGVLAGLMGMVDASIIWWLDHHDEDQVAVVDRIARQVQVILTDLLAQLGMPAATEAVLHPAPPPA